VSQIYIGTAGWTIPTQLKSIFPHEGSHLERYSSLLNAVEINSAFYRDHKKETYEKWASMVPRDFKFSVKLSRHFTQQERLRDPGVRLPEVIDGLSGLGDKMGVLLVQLPPSLEFEPTIAEIFMRSLRKYYSGDIVWEPRHLSWASKQALSILRHFGISKVLADPQVCPIPRAERAMVESVRYLRLHGSPEIYRSRYSQKMIQRIAESILSPIFHATTTWCIFDNTTFGFATENALELKTFFSRSKDLEAIV
jgi:uncharacterized protein YecE (DUF72 family)